MSKVDIVWPICYRCPSLKMPACLFLLFMNFDGIFHNFTMKKYERQNLYPFIHVRTWLKKGKWLICKNESKSCVHMFLTIITLQIRNSSFWSHSKNFPTTNTTASYSTIPDVRYNPASMWKNARFRHTLGPASLGNRMGMVLT